MKYERRSFACSPSVLLIIIECKLLQLETLFTTMVMLFVLEMAALLTEKVCFLIYNILLSNLKQIFQFPEMKKETKEGEIYLNKNAETVVQQLPYSKHEFKPFWCEI